jgi:tetratricopeptide (TPR) repeat protein
MGRGLAYIEKGQPQRGAKELASLRKVTANKMAAEEFVGFSNAQTVLKIAENVLAGELALARKNNQAALTNFETATRLEDSLMYNEPPDWMLPTRHNLGNALLEMGKAAEAETVYWEDLKRNPDNGYSLFGLHQALVAQEKTGDAEMIQGRFDEAWAKADVKLKSSRY